MHVACLDIEGWTSAGQRLPVTIERDCEARDAIAAYVRCNPDAFVLRVRFIFPQGSTVVATEYATRKPGVWGATCHAGLRDTME